MAIMLLIHVCQFGYVLAFNQVKKSFEDVHILSRC